MSAKLENVAEPMGQDQDGESLMNGNENVLSSSELNHNMPFKEGRVIRKAKRPSKQQVPKVKEEGDLPNGYLPTPSTLLVNNGSSGHRVTFAKNTRKSRNGKGRGLAKKGGAGGKGTWGAPGSEVGVTAECNDEHDPNYDSDSQDPIVVKVVKPMLSQEDVEEVVHPILREYLEHGDTEEVAEDISTLGLSRDHAHWVPEMAVSMALDHHAPQREMTSRLISDLYGKVISRQDIEKSFDSLLSGLSDLTLDTPDAPEVIGQFIARAVADDCLPPKYVSGYKGKVECPHVRNALEKADVLLNMKHGIVRLDNVWGVGGGNRPVKYLTKQIILLLKEYLSSGDIAEATRCLKDLDVPHFHHEVVYEATVIVIEDSGERAADMMVKLLKSLTFSNVVTPDQMHKGMIRVYDAMPDLCLDVPAAYTLLDRFATKLHDAHILSERLFKELPSRGRKRFVSEGDGGKFK